MLTGRCRFLPGADPGGFRARFAGTVEEWFGALVPLGATAVITDPQCLPLTAAFAAGAGVAALAHKRLHA